MKKNFKLVKVLLCSLVLLMGFAACSSDKETENGSSTTNTPTQSSTYSFGEEVSGKTKMAMIVHSMEETTDTGNEYITLAEGRKLVIFDVTLTNKAEKELAYNFMYFKAKGTDGVEGDMSFTLIDGTIGSGQLAPNDLVRGKVVFEFAADASIKSFTLTDAIMQKDVEVIFA